MSLEDDWKDFAHEEFIKAIEDALDRAHDPYQITGPPPSYDTLLGFIETASTDGRLTEAETEAATDLVEQQQRGDVRDAEARSDDRERREESDADDFDAE